MRKTASLEFSILDSNRIGIVFLLTQNVGANRFKSKRQQAANRRCNICRPADFHLSTHIMYFLDYEQLLSLFFSPRRRWGFSLDIFHQGAPSYNKVSPSSMWLFNLSFLSLLLCLELIESHTKLQLFFHFLTSKTSKEHSFDLPVELTDSPGRFCAVGTF